MDSCVFIWFKHRLCISAWIWQFHACLYALWCVCSYLFDSDVCLPIFIVSMLFCGFSIRSCGVCCFWYVYDELLQGLLCSYHFCTFVANMCSVQLHIANLSSPRTSSNLPRTLVASMVLTAHVLHFLLHLGMFCHFGADFVRFRIISTFHKGFVVFLYFR